MLADIPVFCLNTQVSLEREDIVSLCREDDTPHCSQTDRQTDTPVNNYEHLGARSTPSTVSLVNSMLHCCENRTLLFSIHIQSDLTIVRFLVQGDFKTPPPFAK